MKLLSRPFCTERVVGGTEFSDAMAGPITCYAWLRMGN